MASAGRWIAAVIIFIIATVLVIGSITAVFVRNELLNTDVYVATVTPLASDPVIQDAVAQRLTNEIVTRTDLQGLANDATAFLVKEGAPQKLSALVPTAVSSVQSFLYTQIRSFVGSKQFQEAWVQANQVGHEQFANVLTGQQGGIIGSSGNAVYIDIGALLSQIKDRLVAKGFSLAANIPQVSVNYTIFESPQLPMIKEYVQWLELAATWLPWVALLLLVVAVLVTPLRRQGILAAGIFLAVGALLALGALSVLRVVYMNRLPPAVQSPQAAEHVYDALVQRPTLAFQILTGIGIAIALIAYLAGPGRLPTMLRRGVSRVLDMPAQALARHRMPHPRWTVRLAKHRNAIEYGLIIVAALIVVLSFFNPVATLWTALGLVILLVVVEIAGRATVKAAAHPA